MGPSPALASLPVTQRSILSPPSSLGSSWLLIQHPHSCKCGFVKIPIFTKKSAWLSKTSRSDQVRVDWCVASHHCPCHNITENHGSVVLTMATGQCLASVVPLSFVAFLKVGISMPPFPQLPNDTLEVLDLRLASLAFEKQILGKMVWIPNCTGYKWLGYWLILKFSVCVSFESIYRKMLKSCGSYLWSQYLRGRGWRTAASSRATWFICEFHTH